MPTGHLGLNWQDLTWASVTANTGTANYTTYHPYGTAVSASAWPHSSVAADRREEDDDIEINEDEWSGFMDSESQ